MTRADKVLFSRRVAWQNELRTNRHGYASVAMFNIEAITKKLSASAAPPPTVQQEPKL